MTYHLSWHMMKYHDISRCQVHIKCNWGIRSPLLWFALWIFALGNLATRRELSMVTSFWLHEKSYLVAATVHFLLVTRSGQKYMTMLLPSHLALSRPARTHRTNIWTTVALIEACLILLDRSSCFLPLLFLPKVLQSDHIWSYLGSMSI